MISDISTPTERKKFGLTSRSPGDLIQTSALWDYCNEITIQRSDILFLPPKTAQSSNQTAGCPSQLPIISNPTLPLFISYFDPTLRSLNNIPYITPFYPPCRPTIPKETCRLKTRHFVLIYRSLLSAILSPTTFLNCSLAM